jgi:hypothetical protein
MLNLNVTAMLIFSDAQHSGLLKPYPGLSSPLLASALARPAITTVRRLRAGHRGRHPAMYTAIALTEARVSAFNATFYSVAATIIPVLFLALAVQGPFLDELVPLADRLSARPSRPSRPLEHLYS